ncbi:MAG: oligosaccharide flippase family protein [Sphingobium sp.]
MTLPPPSRTLTGGGAAKGLAWLVSGRLASAVVSLGSTAILARLLTPSDFGVVAAAFVVLALANVIFDGAFGVNLVRKKELTAQDIGTTLAAALLLSLALAALVVGAAPFIERFFGFPSLGLILIVSAANIPAKAVLSVATAQIQRAGRFRALAGASLWAQVVGYILVGVPAALAGGSVWALVAAMLVSSLTEAVLAVRGARMSLKLAWHRGTLRDIFGSGWLSAAGVVNWAANTGAQTIIGHLLTASALGLYSRSWKLIDLFVAAVSTPLSRILLPLFSVRTDDEGAPARAFLNVLSLVLPFYAVASVLLALQAPAIILLALGPQWTEAIPIAQILFLALVPRCAFKVSENFAVASGRSLSAFYRQGFYAAAMIGGAAVGVRYGVVPVAIAASIAITLFYSVSMTYAIRLSGVTFRSVIVLHGKAAAVAASAAVADALVLFALGDGAGVPGHMLAGSAGAAMAAAIVLLARHRLFSPEAVRSLERMLAAVMAKTHVPKLFSRFGQKGA